MVPDPHLELAIATRSRLIGSLAILLLAPGLVAHAQATPSQAAQSSARDELHRLFEEDAQRTAALDPLALLFRGIAPEPETFAQLFTGSLEAEQDRQARRAIESLKPIDLAQLSAGDRISRAVFVWDKRLQLRPTSPQLRAASELRPLNHFAGLHAEYPQATSAAGPLPFATKQDYREVLALHRAFPQVLANAVARMGKGIAAGATEPRHSALLILAQIDAVLAQPVEQSAFLTPLAQMPTGIEQSEQAQLRAEFDRAVREGIYPAYRELRAFLADEYLPAAREAPGLGAMVGGDLLYRELIERETTLALAPDELHSLGLSEVARIRGEMDAVRQELAPQSADLAAFFAMVRSDPRFHPASRAQLAFGYREIGERVERQLPRYFARLPKTSLRIAPYPASREASEPGGAYYQAPADGARPATFFFNTYDLPSRYLTGMTTLYLHEALPGHHLQVALAQEDETLPDFQRWGGNNAFVEGWALYAETLGREMGLFRDPMQLWGHLDDEMLRAMRLVVDTGLHAKGWSRAQAIDYMLANSGIGRLDAEIEVDRYIAIPAQALSYKIGGLTIQRLRMRAEVALGNRFDLRAFHSQVLDSGALPLPVLEAKIDAWIERQRR